MTRNTPDDLPVDLLTSDPKRFLEIAHEIVAQNPDDQEAYFGRHQAWSNLGRHDLALADIEKAIELGEPHFFLHQHRGLCLRKLNRHEEAIAEFNRAQALDPESWIYTFGPLFRAHSHALLGHLAEGLADCAALLADHWTPGLFGAPRGTKEQVTEEIRRLANETRRR